MTDGLPTSNRERETGLTWLRGALTSAVEVAPLSYQQKKKAAPLFQRLPDWLMAKWAESVNIDYASGCTACPDMAEKVKSEAGRNIAQQYLETHDAVSVGFCLSQLCRSVLKHAREGRLPLDGDTVLCQVCALAWAGCTEAGTEFAGKAREILSDPESPNHVLIDYQIALERGDKDKLEKLDDILTGGRYGEWIDARLDEVKRYLGRDYPVFRINSVERTPQWDAFWENMIKEVMTDE